MKSNKSILLVSWSFPPVKSPRAIKAEAIVKGFLEKYSSVTLVTRDVSEEYLKENYPALKVIPLRESGLGSFSVDLKKSEGFGVDKLKRILNGLFYKFFYYPDILVMFQVLTGLRLLGKTNFDYVLSIDGPQTMHWAIAYLRARKALNANVWIADNGDPLTRNLLGNMVAPYFKWVEDWFCRQADLLTVPVEEGYSYFKTKFRDKIKVVKHSLIFPNTTYENDTIQNNKAEGLHIAYAGNMMPYQKVAKIFFKHLEELEDSLTLHIYGPNDNFIEGIINDRVGLKAMVINHGLIDRMQLLIELKKMDFLVYFPYNETGQIPFKLIDYAFTGKPVLKFEKEKKYDLEAFVKGDYKNKELLPAHENYDYRITTGSYIKFFEQFD